MTFEDCGNPFGSLRRLIAAPVLLGSFFKALPWTVSFPARKWGLSLVAINCSPPLIGLSGQPASTTGNSSTSTEKGGSLLRHGDVEATPGFLCLLPFEGTRSGSYNSLCGHWPFVSPHPFVDAQKALMAQTHLDNAIRFFHPIVTGSSIYLPQK